MKKIHPHRPSASMLVAITALIVAASGTAIAAGSLVNGDKLIAKKTLSGNRLRNHTLTGTQINLNLLGQVPSAKTAINATYAAQAGTAMSAGAAQSLGGIPASGYTRSDCGSLTGQVKGFAMVPADVTYPATLTNIYGAYNCTGQAVQARRISTGEYEVKFLGSPVRIAIGTSQQAYAGFPQPTVVSVSNQGPGDFNVVVFNPSSTAVIDNSFALVTP
jgi:hypothetical protein